MRVESLNSYMDCDVGSAVLLLGPCHTGAGFPGDYMLVAMVKKARSSGSSHS